MTADRRWLVALLLVVLTLQFAVAADNPDAGADKNRTAAPVMLDGQTLFRVRGVSALPAETRARRIAERIAAIAADASIPADAPRVLETANVSDIMAGERLIMGVVEADAELEGVGRQTLAGVYANRITEAIAAYRHDRQPRVLLVNTLYALGAAALLVIVVFGLRRAFRRLHVILEQRYKTRVQGLQIRSFQILTVEQLWTALRGLLQAVHVLAVLTSAYAFLHFALNLYPWTRALAWGLLALVLDPLATIGGALLAQVPNLLFLALLFLITRYLLKMVKLFFGAVRRGRVTLTDFDPEWAFPTYRIVRLLIVAFALVVAYPYIPGSDSAAFKGISLFLGVIFSLGSTSIIANLIAGYTMIYRRAFRVGDRIKVGDLIGDVTQTRLQTTHLRSPKNEEIVVPNSLILNSQVINYSSLAEEQGLILHTVVGIGYDTPWRQVEAMLLMAAERTADLLREPPPFVLHKTLGDFCVNYELNVYCAEPTAMNRLYTELHRNILDVFNEYGVQIMSPAYEHDPEQPKLVPREQWYAAPAQAPTPVTVSRLPEGSR